MTLSRRDILKTTVSVTAAAWATSLTPLCAGCIADKKSEEKTTAKAIAKKLPFGLQLYSVRKDCGKDFSGTIAKVAEMGYQAVEFAGFFDHKADEVRKMLDDNNLVCCGSHTQVGDLNEKKFKATVEYHQKLACPYLIVPSLPKEMYRSADAMKKTVDWFNSLAEQIKPYEGMKVGYHAHAQDFTKIDGKTVWDWIFENTPDDFVMQLDTGNCLAGKEDPYSVLKKYPGRSKTVHLKEHGGRKGAPIGEGKVDWKQVVEICQSVGGTEWYIVENEGGKDPLPTVKKCIDNLRKMSF